MSDRIAYKLMTEAELAQMRREAVFLGSAVDVADGFIHLSSAAQVTATLEKHFRSIDDLVICAIDLDQLGNAVRWEPSRGGDLFPHIHGALPLSAVVAIAPVRRGPDDLVILPV